MANDQLILEKLGQLESILNRVAVDVTALKVDMSEVKATLKKQSDMLNDLQMNQDWLIGKFRKFDQEQVFGSANLERMRKDVDELKTRLERLELSPQSA